MKHCNKKIALAILATTLFADSSFASNNTLSLQDVITFSTNINNIQQQIAQLSTTANSFSNLPGTLSNALSAMQNSTQQQQQVQNLTQERDNEKSAKVAAEQQVQNLTQERDRLQNENNGLKGEIKELQQANNQQLKQLQDLWNDSEKHCATEQQLTAAQETIAKLENTIRTLQDPS